MYTPASGRVRWFSSNGQFLLVPSFQSRFNHFPRHILYASFLSPLLTLLTSHPTSALLVGSQTALQSFSSLLAFFGVRQPRRGASSSYWCTPSIFLGGRPIFGPHHNQPRLKSTIQLRFCILVAFLPLTNP